MRHMSLDYAFDKAKLPKGLSFPLKRNVLDAALAEAGVAKIQCVYYWRRQRGTCVLRANFCGEGRRGWAAAGLSSITLYAVPSFERLATEVSLVSELLPRMIKWLVDLQSAGNARRGTDQDFAASWDAGVVAVEAS